MFIIMTMDTEVFPIAPIRRIIVMITILVMHRQLVQIGGIKLTPAFGADRPMHPDRFRAVVGVIIHPLAQGIDAGGGLFGAGELDGDRTALFHDNLREINYEINLETEVRHKVTEKMLEKPEPKSFVFDLIGVYPRSSVVTDFEVDKTD